MGRYVAHAFTDPEVNMLPHVTLTGNLTRDPELSFTPKGKPKAVFTVACNHRVRQGDGTWKDEGATFVQCVVWGDTAEAVTESLRKGSHVTVVGRLKQRSWEDPQTGAKRSLFEVDPEAVSLVLKAQVTRRATPAEEDPWAIPPEPPADGF